MVAAGFKLHKIRASRPFGERLRRARKRLGVDLIEAELATKIRAKYLEALENEDFEVLPNDIYVKGFVITYAKYLKLDPEKFFNLFLKQRSAVAYSQPANFLVKKTKTAKSFILSPKILTIFFVAVLSILAISYVTIGVYNFTSVPQLEIFTPVNNSATADEIVNITGKTEESSRLFINKQSVSIGESGNFQLELSLQNGINTIVVTSEGRNNRISSKIIIVERKMKTASGQ
ncbi:MAG: transcriptional regulator, XRE family [Candidatus Berkelbacteria bacterium Athens1014_28]|uniref:Transcriptional regulator, XRE family n=1 Tax=Candidatus Berkelbacteria bacterium Athens1014_28 TaxID=2017145 RepID=A0A554LLX1_9BACT|nr:MAG: transcriptional regulator, XRE family [Candidatus Berkelbacteria bacterium Athens1014_28]